MPGGIYSQPFPSFATPMGGGSSDVWRVLAELLRSGPQAAPFSLSPGRGGGALAMGGRGWSGGADIGPGLRAMENGFGRLIPQLQGLFDDGMNGVGKVVPGSGFLGTDIGGIPYADALHANIIPL